QFGDGRVGHNGSVAGNIVNKAALAYDPNGGQVYAGTITGSGSLIKIGTGTLTLANNNAYSGPTVIIGGTLKMQPSPGIPAGAVAAYTFADGLTATDVSGNGNNGTLNVNPTFVQGQGPGTNPNTYSVSLNGST